MSIQERLDSIIDDSDRSRAAVEIYREIFRSLTAKQIAKLPTKRLREAAILAESFLYYH